MKSFTNGQRVKVLQNADGIGLSALGTVKRLRSDAGAWIELDRRSKVSAVHPFPEDDDRGCHVIAYPDDCELAQANSKERRKAKRHEKRPAPEVTQFGKDHWSTFAYIECVCTDAGGVPDVRRMRCHPGRHPLLVNGMDGSQYSTRLKGSVLSEHDDWDCAEDLEAAGLIENTGTAATPRFRMTDLGNRVASQLRVWKQKGGNFKDFEPQVVDGDVR